MPIRYDRPETINTTVASDICQDKDAGVVAIYIHPDDELNSASLLMHLADEGVPVHTIYISSGDTYTIDMTEETTSEEIVARRESEIVSACEAYGINKPILLREHSDTLGIIPWSEFDRISKRVAEAIRSTGAKTWLTFGPEGYTGHADHKAVHCMVSALFQSWDVEQHGGWGPDALYYTGFPASRYAVMPEDQKFFNPLPVLDESMTVVVDSKQCLPRLRKAVYCYPSQFPEPYAGRIFDVMTDVLEGKTYLRLGMVR